MLLFLMLLVLVLLVLLHLALMGQVKVCFLVKSYEENLLDIIMVEIQFWIDPRKKKSLMFDFSMYFLAH